LLLEEAEAADAAADAAAVVAEVELVDTYQVQPL
jgi:hypothetical protein